MAWFRRRPTPEPEAAAEVGFAPTPDDLLVVESTDSLARTARALEVLAVQSNHVYDRLVDLEARVDALTAAFADRDPVSVQDLLDARVHTTKVAAEVSRLEINVAARLEAVVADVRRLQGEPEVEVDLRDLTPTDTGWARPRAS